MPSPCFRQISTVGSQVSYSLIIPIIGASVKRLFLITSAPSNGQTLHLIERSFGGGEVTELCLKEGIAQSLFYPWSKEFTKAGKRRVAGGTARAATA